MEKQFIRAKSKENKAIRIQQIADAADGLFSAHTYHEITLSTISEAAGIARGGLYKYVSSKEEIFLLLYLQKQEEMLKDALAGLRGGEITAELIAHSLSAALHRHFDFLKYHQIQNAIIETNVSVEKLAEFKLRSLEQRQELFGMITAACKTDRDRAYDAYLSILAHAVYLRDRQNCEETYVRAMELAGLEITPVDFEKNLRRFAEMYLKHCAAAEG